LNAKVTNISFFLLSLRKYSNVQKKGTLFFCVWTKKTNLMSLVSRENNPGKTKFVSSAVERRDIREGIE
jgi:hypothetical protein